MSAKITNNINPSITFELLCAYEKNIEEGLWDKTLPCLELLLKTLNNPVQKNKTDTLLKRIKELSDPNNPKRIQEIKKLAEAQILKKNLEAAENLILKADLKNEDKLDFFALLGCNYYLRDWISNKEVLGERVSYLQNTHFPKQKEDFCIRMIKIFNKYPNFMMPKEFTEIDKQVLVTMKAHIAEHTE